MRLRRSLLAICALLAACTPHAPAPVAPATGGVRFLLINDVYVVGSQRDGSGGIPRVAALRHQLAGDGRAPIFVLAGDVLSPSLLSKWYAGRQMVEALDTAGLDYATFGNHEFELDRPALEARIAESHFRWVSSNCTAADGSPFARVLPWDTLTVNGVRVGVFGLTVIGDYRSYVRCTDTDSAAHRVVATLRAVGAQLVVGITHQNLSTDSLLLAHEPGVDLILGGHEHEWHEVRSAGKLVAKADANARSAQLVTARRQGDGWQTDTRLIKVEASLPEDPATARVVQDWTDSLVHRLGPERPVGTAAAPIDARDAVGRTRESALGDLVTDAIRAGTGADVAIINAGSMRVDDVLRAGPITNYQLESIFLFADETHVITFPITGGRLRTLLEHSVSDGAYGHGGFLQVSGIAFTYDPSRAEGARLVGPLRRADGTTLGDADSVRLAFNAYPACSRGDGYVVPEAAAACPTATSGPRAVDLLMTYITGTLHGTIGAPTSGRITRQ